MVHTCSYSTFLGKSDAVSLLLFLLSLQILATVLVLSTSPLQHLATGFVLPGAETAHRETQFRTMHLVVSHLTIRRETC